MRLLLMITSLAMALFIAVEFVGESGPSLPFEDMNVVLICGNDEFGEIQRAISVARAAAENDFGCTVEVYYTGWSTEDESVTLRQYMSIYPAGIAIMGYPGHDALAPIVEEAYDLDVPVTSFGIPFDEVAKTYGANGFGYAGPDHYQMGYDLARAAVEKHALEAGSEALLLGDLDHPARAPLRDGFRAGFEEAGLQVEHLATTPEKMESVDSDVIDALSQRKADGNLPGVLAYTDLPVRPAANALSHAGVETGEVPLIGVGIRPRADAERVSAEVGERHVSLLAGRDLAIEAYLAILQICMNASINAPGLQIDVPVELLGRDTANPRSLARDSFRFVQVY